MMFKYLMRTSLLTLGIVGAAIVANRPIPATAQAESYPWCTQGSTLHCYYLNREQCEQTVDYHGFCEPNPDYRLQGNGTDRRRPGQ
jgi:hypothetical protein